MTSNGSGADECSNQQDHKPTALLLLPLLLSLLWVLLDLFYSSRLLGWALTRVAAFFLTDSAIHLGSVQINLLTGRILFKDLHYICRDFAIRVTDGYAVCRWWKRAGGGCQSCGCGGSLERRTALVLFQLNGFQLHWYNRSDVYDNWGKVEPGEAGEVETTDESWVWGLWKELRPSLHFIINKGRVVFGSQLVEQSLTVYCQAADAHYHTSKASNDYDELMHVVKLSVSDVKTVLEPSVGSAIPENVVHILRSDMATVTYSWDTPGPGPQKNAPDPRFSWEIELGSNSVINYGSYANHQRHILQSYFFPNDYTERPPSHVPQPGERRVYASMDVTVRLSSKGSFNIPFNDEKDKLHQIGLSLGEGSEVKVHQPWITNKDGYTSVVTGTLQDVVVTSDLSYPHLASSATVQLNLSLHFPRVWNSTQHWDMQLEASKVEVSILFSYIDFVNALLDDWLGSDVPDLLNFVPVNWTITASLSQYEIYMYTSRYNWLDKDDLENSRLAFCGSTGQIKLHFPFTVFNPEEQRVSFSADGGNIVVRHYLPPSDSAREAVLALAAANRYRWRVPADDSHSLPGDEMLQGKEALNRETFPMGYRRRTAAEDGWVDMACGPSISITIGYVSRGHHSNPALPNTMQISITAPTVLLRVYGFLATDLLALKENYPGEYIEFSTYHSTFPAEPGSPLAPQPPLVDVPPAVVPSGVPDLPQERFLDVVVDFSLHDVTAEFPTFPSQGQPVDAVLPSACTAEIAVHVDYTAADTKVFLYLRPFTVLIPSWPSGEGAELGHIVCGGLQLNCHGLTEMLCGERVEYAWLMQLQLSRITAALTTSQLTEAGGWLQATVQQVVGVADSKVKAPNGKPIQPVVEPVSEDIKYTLFDLSVAEADIHITDGEHLIRLQTPGMDMGMCELHAESETLGLSLQLHALSCSMCTPVAGDTQRLAEAGQVEVGLVQADITLRKPKDCVPERQLAFLRRADLSTRRLWFLWSEESSSGPGVSCGCWGGCQFLDSCISRHPPKPATTSAVYTSARHLPFLKSGTMCGPLQALKKSLQTVCVGDVACPQLIHTGLQAYYDTQSPWPPAPQTTGSDTESFVSARSESASDTNEFFSMENVNEAGLEGQSLEPDPLHSPLASYIFHTIPIYVKTQLMRRPADIPLATPPRTPSPAQRATRSNSLLLRLPVVIPDKKGSIPDLTTPSLTMPDSPGEKDSGQSNQRSPQYSVGVSVLVCGSVTVTLSPLITDVITSVANSLTSYFKQRGALAVLSGCSLETTLSLNSHLNQLLNPPHDLVPVSTQVSLVMDRNACIAVRLVQSLPQPYQLPPAVSRCSLVTAAVGGMQLSSLIRIHTEKVSEDEDSQCTISSLQLSLQGQCKTVQLTLATLLSDGVTPPPSFPNLLTNSSRLQVMDHSPSVCSLLEMGCVSPSFDLVAKIVTLEVSHRGILTWEQVQSEAVDRKPTSQQTEQVNNKLAVSVTLPQLWIDIAAPHTGRLSASTGGLDLMVGGAVGVVWQSRLKVIVRHVQELMDAKRARDRRVFLGLLTGAARSEPTDVAVSPLLTPVAAAVRQCVAFQCLHQMWVCLPAFSETQLASIPSSHSCQEELLASTLSLATRFYFEGNCSAGAKKLPPSPAPIDHTTCPTCGPYRRHGTAVAADVSSQSSSGYIRGVSPSPSELALPNTAFSTQQIHQASIETFEELYHSVSFDEVVVVRESLLPLLKAVSVPTAPQLRALCHNRQQVQIDCSLQLRDGTVYVLEPSSSRTIPALNLKQSAIRGNLQANWDSPSSTPSPSLSLLSASSRPSHSGSKRNVSCLFSGQAGVVSVGVTEPLLKLCRHSAETSQFISQSAAAETHTAPTGDETDSGLQHIQPSSLWHFSQDLISHITSLQREGLQNVARQQDEPSRISLSRPSSAGSAHSRSVRPVLADLSHSPRNITIISNNSPSTVTPHHLSPPVPPHRHRDHSLSNESSVSAEVAIQMEQVDASLATSPTSQSPMDTSGGDLASSDDMQLSSGSHRATPSSLPPTSSLDTTPAATSQGLEWLEDTPPLRHILQTPPTQLSHSIFGLLRLDSLSFSFHVETCTASLRLAGIAGCVDSRQLGSAGEGCLPAYLSVAATVKTTQLGISDRTLTDNEMLRVIAQPIHCSVGLSKSYLLPMATYRCLLKVQGCKLVVKQPPVLVHKRVQQLLPAFTRIYQNIFSPVSETGADSQTPSQQQASNLAAVEMPSQLPQGYIHLNISRVELVMTPLPSLSITYTVHPVVARMQTAQKIHYHISIGSHTLRFNPREHQVTLRSLVLPTVTLSGDVRRSKATRLPQVCMKLAVQRVNIDLTTDSLNQLLVLQNSFIKEVNELVQLFINIGESLPQQHRPADHAKLERRESDSGGVKLLSLLDSCHLSVDEICITVSTPLSTALRFSTSRIDMGIMNSSGVTPSSRQSADTPVTRSQLLLSGRVEINVNLALGYLQDSSSEDDDFCELAYFRTKISIRNTQQNAPRLSLVGGTSEEAADQPLDTFFISIICPHLYIQSSAVEQAILFWLNCKSVYSYWQHQRKMLNDEVREATEMFVAQIQARRPTNLQGPSLDFSKPKLVQISVTDVGACMPMAAMFNTPQSSQKAFPALVLTIKEMLLVVNLSRKVASSGSFSGFCLRFANQFSLRQRTWTMDTRKNKIINCGVVNQGTFRLCIATKKCRSETDNSVVLGEKLLWAFQWDMSGIDVNANSDIGYHMSTLVRTATTIGTSLEGHQPTHLARTGPATPPVKVPRKLHKRTVSDVGSVRHEPKIDRVEEGMTNLAKGTIHVSKLQSAGASRDSLKREIEALKETEHHLRKKVGRLFRRRGGFSIRRLTEFFSPTNADKMERGNVLRRRWTLKNPRKLFSTGDPQPSIPEEGEGDTGRPLALRQRSHTIHHSRTLSDISEHHALPGEEDSSSPSLTPSATPVPGEEGPLMSPFPPTPISSTPVPPSHTAFSFQQAPLQPPAAGLMASIDVEVNVTVNIDSGIVKLRCKDDSFAERRTASPNLRSSAHRRLIHSASSTPPLQSRSVQGRAKDSANDTIIILIPALNVQVHYKSIISQSYQFPSPTSSLTLSSLSTGTPTHAAPAPEQPQLPKLKITPETPTSASLPMKKGLLSISVVVASTPEDMTLTSSLLEFVEQVVRPTIAATADTNTNSTSESDSEEESGAEEVEERKENSDSPAISFPVDVTIVFQMQPSKICLSCQPHSRVNCIVSSPNVNFVVSFSLFSQREREGPLPSPGPPSVVTFNNLYVTGCLKTFTLQLLSPQVPTLKKMDSDPEKKLENREALSLTLGQALTHLSRKSVLTGANGTSPGSSRDDSSTHSKLQVSVVTNIASLVLGYDMRRLNDLTTFRRYWYRTSLIESFIGSKKPQQPGGDGHEQEEEEESDGTGTTVTLDNSISAAIVVAATVDDFRISANVAQVMGNTNLVVTHLQCQAHADISRNELVFLRLRGGMERGEVDARGGMVAGFVLMQNVRAQVTTESHHGLIPVHTGRLNLSMAEARVDYMSSCILLGQASQLTVAVKDLWEGLQLAGQGDTEEANIQVLVDLSWEQVQLAIHRTTTKSAMNILQKIQDFVLQQKRRSERTISIMLPADTRVSKALAAYREQAEQAEQAEQKRGMDKVTTEHHHWLWATRFGSLELMRALGVPTRPGQHDVSLGGKITLSGQNFCLVCFHGTSFRDHEWAVFNIDQLAASFLTLAIPGLRTTARAVTRTCQQICRLQLGGRDCKLSELATVHRVSAGRGRVPPITGTNINNWLAYACIDSHLHWESYDSPTTAQQTVLKFSKRLTIQQVLLVPGLTVELINDHFWPVLSTCDLQQLLKTPPVVECSLLSQFSAGISVSTNVDHYLFLHDLVTNYIDYMERHKVPLRETQTEEKEEVGKGKGCLRQFHCVSWQLEPRLTLLSSVRGEFNPHISWLLETLGFKHARTTIPKWVQRGAMDPLDKAVAVVVQLLIQFSAKKKLYLHTPQ